MKKRKFTRVIAIGVCLTMVATIVGSLKFLSTVSAQVDAIIKVRCEYQENPIGISTQKPVFEWEVQDYSQGAKQTGYRILVASTMANLDNNVGDMWDSGMIESDQSNAIEYAGTSLASNTKYYWKVRVLGADNTDYGYSEVGSFTTAFVNDQFNYSYNIAGDSWFRIDYLEDEVWDRDADTATVTIKNTGTAAFSVVLEARNSSWSSNVRSTSVSIPAGQTSTLTVTQVPDNYVILLLWVSDIAGSTTFSICNVKNLKLASDLQENNGATSTTIVTLASDYQDWGSSNWISIETPAAWSTYWNNRKAGLDSTWDSTDSWHMDYCDKTQQELYDWAESCGGTKASPQLRKEFTVQDKTIVSANLYVAGLGYYEAYINGEKVGDRVLEPAQTNYAKTVYYTSYNVLDMLDTGDNAIGIWLGRGWYNLLAQDNWKCRDASWVDQPKARSILKIQYSDGTTQDICSDSTWQAKYSPIIWDDVRLGEIYDATQENENWAEVSCDTTGWQNANIQNAPAGVLTTSQINPMRVTNDLSGRLVETLPDGSLVYDFGEDFSGWGKLKIENATPGQTVTVEFSTIRTTADNYSGAAGEAAAMGANVRYQTQTYIAKGSGTETYEPRFTYFTFRYARVYGITADKLLLLTGRMVYSDLDTTTDFNCSDDIITETFDMAMRTTSSLLHSFPEDSCREKLGWTRNGNIPNLFNNYSSEQFFEKWVKDMDDAQTEVGVIPEVSPIDTMYEGEFFWGGSFILVPWDLYRTYGDTRLIKQYYEDFKSYYNWAEDRFAVSEYVDGQWVEIPGLMNGFLGDWVSLGNREAPEGSVVGTTVYYYWFSDILSQMAEIAGETADVAQYEANKVTIANALNTKLYDASSGYYISYVIDNATQHVLSTYTDYRQFNNIMPLFMDLVPSNVKDTVVSNLLNDIQENGINVGIVGAEYIFDVLSMLDEFEIATDFITNPSMGNIGYYLDNGWTTLGEQWENTVQTIHESFASVGGKITQYIGGIRYDSDVESGANHILIAPEMPEGLTWANTNKKTNKGTVSVAWERLPDSIQIQTTIPWNTTATVKIPKKEVTSPVITLDGVTVWENDALVTNANIISAVEDDRYISFEVEAGTYNFEMSGDNGAVLPTQEIDASDVIMGTSSSGIVPQTQKWVYEFVRAANGSENIYRIKNAATGLYVTIGDLKGVASESNSKNLVMSELLTGDQAYRQEWKLSGPYMVHPTMDLWICSLDDLIYAGYQQWGQTKAQWTLNGEENALPTADTEYIVQSASTNNVISLVSSIKVTGVTAQTDKWVFEFVRDKGDGTYIYHIKNATNGKYITVGDSRGVESELNSKNLILSDLLTGDQAYKQEWKLSGPYIVHDQLDIWFCSVDNVVYAGYQQYGQTKAQWTLDGVENSSPTTGTEYSIISSATGNSMAPSMSPSLEGNNVSAAASLVSGGDGTVTTEAIFGDIHLLLPDNAFLEETINGSEQVTISVTKIPVIDLPNSSELRENTYYDNAISIEAFIDGTPVQFNPQAQIVMQVYQRMNYEVYKDADNLELILLDSLEAQNCQINTDNTIISTNISSTGTWLLYYNDLNLHAEDYANVLAAGTQFIAKEVSFGTDYNTVDYALTDISKQFIAFNASFLNNGTNVTPSGNIRYQFAIPEEFNISNCALYYVDQDGEKESIAFTVNNEEIIFETSYTGLFTLSEGYNVTQEQAYEYSFLTGVSSGYAFYNLDDLGSDVLDLEAGTADVTIKNTSATTFSACLESRNSAWTTIVSLGDYVSVLPYATVTLHLTGITSQHAMLLLWIDNQGEGTSFQIRNVTDFTKAAVLQSQCMDVGHSLVNVTTVTAEAYEYSHNANFVPNYVLYFIHDLGTDVRDFTAGTANITLKNIGNNTISACLEARNGSFGAEINTGYIDIDPDETITLSLSNLSSDHTNLLLWVSGEDAQSTFQIRNVTNFTLANTLQGSVAYDGGNGATMVNVVHYLPEIIEQVPLVINEPTFEPTASPSPTLEPTATPSPTPTPTLTPEQTSLEATLVPTDEPSAAPTMTPVITSAPTLTQEASAEPTLTATIISVDSTADGSGSGNTTEHGEDTGDAATTICYLLAAGGALSYSTLRFRRKKL